MIIKCRQEHGGRRRVRRRHGVTASWLEVALGWRLPCSPKAPLFFAVGVHLGRNRLAPPALDVTVSLAAQGCASAERCE